MHSLTFGFSAFFLLRKQSLPSDVRYMQLEIDEEVHCSLDMSKTVFTCWRLWRYDTYNLPSVVNFEQKTQTELKIHPKFPTMWNFINWRVHLSIGSVTASSDAQPEQIIRNNWK